MGFTDFTRNAFNPQKQYSGVRMQQGRVLMDDDWNEQGRILADDKRQAQLDIIGPGGSPDNGFRIVNANLTGTPRQIHFNIEAGNYYLGGNRLQLPALQSYREQKDWLQGPDDSVTAPASERIDLAYLETFEQAVTAVEDSELFDVSLGGPDTSTRLRRFQRVRLLSNVPADCAEARQHLNAFLTGTLNGENELTTDAKCTLSYRPDGTPSNLCTPSVAGGYLGAENQAIRVQLTDAGHFTWGFNNASPLYRVRLSADRQTVTLDTDPKDEAHWPASGQVVEILPWSAVLPNNEKPAEEGGHLTTLTSSYTADDPTVTLQTAVPVDDFDDWNSRSDASSIEGSDGSYYYMRVWDRGDDTGSAASLPFTAGTPVDLGFTGLRVTFSGTVFHPGDYWVLAARPETPDQVVPWDLETGRAPHGPKRFYAPLALIHWHFSSTSYTHATIQDCRKLFLPLTHQHACCTVVVGDGITTHGHVNSLEQALARIGDDPAHICLLPGDHRANVNIRNRKRLKITGCEHRTRIMPTDEALDHPIFTLAGVEEIVFEHLDIVAPSGIGIHVQSALPERNHILDIRNNRFFAFTHAIRLEEGHGIDIRNNLIRMIDKAGGDVAIHCSADDCRIVDNDLGVIPAEVEPPPPPDDDEEFNPTHPCFNLLVFLYNRIYLRAYLHFVWNYVLVFFPLNPFQTQGGIRLGGGVSHVSVKRNRVCGGNANGITLGNDLDLDAILPGPSDTPSLTEASVRADKNGIRGYVQQSDGEVLAGVRLTFLNSAGKKTFSTTTGSDGVFQSTKITPGSYTVTADGYNIDNVRFVRDTRVIRAVSTYTVLTVSPRAETPSAADLTAFLYDIIIRQNKIEFMGRCGIGVPLITADDIRRLAPALKTNPALMRLIALGLLTGSFGGFLVDAVIQDNHIRKCMQNNFDPALRQLAAIRGFGGISLALCESLCIGENRIEDNGRNHISPICGVFITYADYINAANNQILNNGPIDSRAGIDLDNGFRGGLVVRAATAQPLIPNGVPSDETPPVDTAPDDISTSGTPAADISPTDSTAAGPSASDISPVNGATSEMALSDTAAAPVTPAPATIRAAAIVAPVPALVIPKALYAAKISDNIIEQPVGQALSLQAVGPVSITGNQFTTQFSSNANLAAALIVKNLGSVFRSARNAVGGNILFANNQTLLGHSGNTMLAQLLVSLDDIGFISNQCDVVAESRLLINTLLSSISLRATNNRLKEPVRGEKLSMLTFAQVMNTTTNNQGNYCIAALCLYIQKLIDDGNLAALRSTETCEAGSEFLLGLFNPLVRAVG